MMDERYMMSHENEQTMDDLRDARVGELLALLDPDRTDPGYWHRFQRWAVNRAAPELARRRRAAAVTVGDVMISWWRALVPAAALAAALAVLTLGQQAPQDVAYATGTVEELLTEGLIPAPLPAGLTLDGSPVDGVAFASETF